MKIQVDKITRIEMRINATKSLEQFLLKLEEHIFRGSAGIGAHVSRFGQYIQTGKHPQTGLLVIMLHVT